MKKRILIVDDKETIAKLVAMYLSDFDFVYFDNPIKAISWLHEGNIPDLIISDIRMPEMMGDEFLAYLKGNELFKSIPVVMLSAEDSSSARIKLLESGAADYIVKPFNPMELKIRITRILI
ncbi:MAG: response regulator [Flavobacteriales bacterium]|nr:response regulator [Flavobacteriales bacterium]